MTEPNILANAETPSATAAAFQLKMARVSNMPGVASGEQYLGAVKESFPKWGGWSRTGTLT